TRLGEVLVARGVITKEQLAHANAVRMGIGVHDPATQIEPAALELVDERTARKYQAVPVRLDPDGHVAVAMVDPQNVFALDDLRIVFDRPI
ncbi:MAG: type II/IV secretion system protein, partial [Thermoleophilia bacterium]|nr:type II/IV secretion system protein [Thermoleophilia bacterium]